MITRFSYNREAEESEVEKGAFDKRKQRMILKEIHSLTDSCIDSFISDIQNLFILNDDSFICIFKKFSLVGVLIPVL